VVPFRKAADGEEFRLHSNGEQWLVAWHPPHPVPDGQPHGANAFCVTSDGNVVLISSDGERWGWPGGRPKSGEDWEQTLRREMLEEACVRVVQARLIGFARSRCLDGPEQGLVLVRSIWRAEVNLLPWDPKFEVPLRRVVPAAKLRDHWWIENDLLLLYNRAVHEAGLATVATSPQSTIRKSPGADWQGR
jgi:ADP-ribose pyrophosphatase YjhB (NUDIX family)